MDIPVLYERPRGCGYRKKGGIYLCSDAPNEPCSALPVSLEVCPVCSGGIKPTRGWTWIEPDPIVQPRPHGSPAHDSVCPIADRERLGERCGLLWIGGQFYSTASFTQEAVQRGVSRRLSTVPRELRVGSTWVLLAHREAVPVYEGKLGGWAAKKPKLDEDGKHVHHAGIFTAFKPNRIEYIVRGDESEDILKGYVERGITPVRVVRVEDESTQVDSEAEAA